MFTQNNNTFFKKFIYLLLNQKLIFRNFKSWTSYFKGLSSNSNFIYWAVWSTFWSEVITSRVEICWDRHLALKYLMHWYTYSLYQWRTSRNKLTLDAHFLNTCVTGARLVAYIVLMDVCPRCSSFFLQPWNFEEWEAPAPLFVHQKERLEFAW